MRAVIDVCVLISALMSSSSSAAPQRVIDQIEAGRIRAIASPQLLDELAKTLTRPKIRKRVSEREAKAFVATFRRYADSAPDVANPQARTRDPEDDYLVELAIVYGVPLVSTDKDVLEADLSVLQ